MVLTRIKKFLALILTTTIVLTPLFDSKVYAIPATCTSGAFLGWSKNLDSLHIMNTAPYAGNVNMVSFDLANWGYKWSSLKCNEESVGDDERTYNGHTYKNFEDVAQYGKDTIISAETPNPEGKECKYVMSNENFYALSNTKIQDINSSSTQVLKNYKVMVDKVAKELSTYHNELMNANPNAKVYFRPFHEMNGDWFWWAHHDKNQFKNLWINFHDYLVNNCGLSWLKFCYAVNRYNIEDPNSSGDNISGDAIDYYPGDNYVDIVGVDAYDDNPENDKAIKDQYIELTGGYIGNKYYEGVHKPFGFPEMGPGVYGNYIYAENFKQSFDYGIWSKAITDEYPKAKYSIVYDGSYAPDKHINGEALFNNYQDENTNINYQTHVQYIGWQDTVSNGEIAGTVGQSLQVEAIKLNYPNQANLNVQYRAHVQNIGWMDWVKNGEQAGTTGQGLRMEAIEIKLKDNFGSDSSNYSIYYRTHVQNIGWTKWTKNGNTSGTTGQGLRMEAIQIYVVKNGTSRGQEMENMIQTGE